MKGVTGIEFEIDDPQQIEEFRKQGIDIPYRIKDAFYSSPGGLTTESKSTQVKIMAENLYVFAERAMKYVNENRPKIDKVLSQKNYDPANAGFRLKFSMGDFFIYEESMQSIVSLTP
jgi:hypothetical protein